MSVTLLGLRGVDGLTLVLDIGDESVLVIGGVGDDLGAAVGEGDTVGSLEVAVGVLLLSLVEAGAGVVIGDSVLVGEGLGRELLLLVGSRLMVGWGRWGVGRPVSEGHGHKGAEDGELEKMTESAVLIALGILWFVRDGIFSTNTPLTFSIFPCCCCTHEHRDRDLL